MKKFFKWFLNYYKEINEDFSIFISIPNELSQKFIEIEDDVLVIDFFKKSEFATRNEFDVLNLMLEKCKEYEIKKVYLDASNLDSNKLLEIGFVPIVETTLRYDILYGKYYVKFVI